MVISGLFFSCLQPTRTVAFLIQDQPFMRDEKIIFIPKIYHERKIFILHAHQASQRDQLIAPDCYKFVLFCNEYLFDASAEKITVKIYKCGIQRVRYI